MPCIKPVRMTQLVTRLRLLLLVLFFALVHRCGRAHRVHPPRGLVSCQVVRETRELRHRTCASPLGLPRAADLGASSGDMAPATSCISHRSPPLRAGGCETGARKIVAVFGVSARRGPERNASWRRSCPSMTA